MNWMFVPVLIAWCAIVVFQEFSEEEALRSTTRKRTLIQLAKVVNDTLLVNDTALSNLMERDELQGRPLMILSIAGELRTGKSFIMNIFLRYLRNNGWKNSNWFYDETVIDQDFKYDRGSDVVTQGMVVHSEIFQIPLENGSQAAVILVDTQGLYDTDTSKDCNFKLAALSVLFSSHQILNLKEKIKANDLEDLQLCVGIAKQAEDHSREETKPFQALTLLIRDWIHKHEYQFGDSTDGHLAKFMDKKSKSESLQKVKDYIPRAFSRVGCYLLPHPGETVATSDGKLQNSDMSREFEIETKLFVEYILNPKNVSLKRNFKGDLATASDLFHLIATMGKKFAGQEFYKTKTDFQVMQRASLNRKVAEAVSTYKARMKEICHEHLLMADELTWHHEVVFGAIMKRFMENNKPETDGEVLKEYREQLKNECNNTYSTLATANLVVKNGVLNDARNMMKELTEEFGGKAQTKILLSTTEKEFGRLHRKFQKKALDSFDAKFVNFSKTLGQEWSTVREELVSDIAKAFNQRKGVLEKKKLIQADETSKSKQKALTLTNEFQSERHQYSDEYHENLEEILNTNKEDMLTEYDKKMKMNSEREAVLQNRKHLIRDLDEMIVSSTSKNFKNKDKAEKKARELGEMLALQLEIALAEIMEKNYIDPTALDKTIKAYMTGADKEINSQPPWTIPLIKGPIEGKAKALRNRNEQNKNFRSSWTSYIDEKMLLKLGGAAVSVGEWYFSGTGYLALANVVILGLKSIIL